MDTERHKHALVTGAAGGIGREVVSVLLERGYHLSLLDHDREGLEALVDSPKNTFPLAGDMKDPAFCQQAVIMASGNFGPVDLLVNVAAVSSRSPMTEVTLEEWDHVLRVNLTAPAFLSRWVASSMVDNGGGVIINIGSIESEFPKGFIPAYAAAKGGLKSLTYDLANAWGRKGIRVLMISPGAMDTGLSNDYGDSNSEVAREIREWVEDHVPTGRFGRAVEIARAVAWMASDEASYLTGTEIVIDGGWSHANLPDSLRRRITGE